MNQLNRLRDNRNKIIKMKDSSLPYIYPSQIFQIFRITSFRSFSKPRRIREKNLLNRGLSDLLVDISRYLDIVERRSVSLFLRNRVQPNGSLIFQRDILHDNGSP